MYPILGKSAMPYPVFRQQMFNNSYFTENSEDLKALLHPVNPIHTLLKHLSGLLYLNSIFYSFLCIWLFLWIVSTF